jgi:NADPH2:quinone reductase
MRAIVCPDYGPPSILTVEEKPDPTPGPGQVVVQHKAWGINFVDVLMCAGGYQHKPPVPFVPGLEAAGDVVALGAGVEDFAIGDRVMTSGRPGVFAELCALDLEQVHRMPSTFDYIQASGFRSAYMTAWNALTHGGRLQAGDVLVVHGAAGGVGLAAVHVGRLLGAQVIATAGSDEKLAVVKAQGADHVINYSDPRVLRDAVKGLTDGRGADVIYDPVGGRVAEESLRCMNYGCRVVYIGFTGGPPAQIRSNLLLIKGATAVGFRAGEIGRRIPGLNEQTVATLTRLAEQGRLKPHVSHKVKWPDIQAAMKPIEDRTVIGKVVMEL